MIHFANWLGHWCVDVYLLGSTLLIIALLTTAFLRQPVHRLAVVKSLFVGLALLAALSAIPGWSVLHLIAPNPTARTNAQTAPLLVNPAAPSPSLPMDRNSSATPLLSIPPSHQTDIASRIPLNFWSIVGLTELLGALTVLVWLAAGWLAARHLRRQSIVAPPRTQKLLQDLARASFKRDTTPTPQLLLSSRLNVPVALALRNPVIVLPAHMAESQSATSHSKSEILAILVHELAHIQNRDLHWLALSRALLTLFWSQPLYWFARRRMRLDQESLADAAAADLTTREKYAEQLVTWARTLTNAYPARLASAVGLWEGASQLRQRVALLLDDRVTILRDFSRKWQLGTLSLCIAVAAALSLVTLRPAQSRDELSIESVFLGDRFILCPVTTELQRSLLGHVDEPLAEASLCVFVNFAELKDEPIDASSPFFAGLADKLASLQKSNNELVTFQVLIGPPRPMAFDVAQKRAESLAKTCEALGSSAGFKHSRSSETVLGNDFDWSQHVLDADSATLQAVKSHATLGEQSVGDDRVRVFAVSTFLSHMLAHDTDCVVNIKPFISPQQGLNFPDDFTSELQTFLPKLKFARKNTMLVRVRFAQSDKSPLDRWFKNHDGRQAFARQFGFKNCSCETTQFAAANASPANQSESPPELRTSATELTGRVVGPDGEPLADVTVDAYTWYPGNETKTDNEGRFLLKDLDPREPIEIEFRKDSFGPRHFNTQRAGISDWVIQMDDSTYLEGRVLDPQGAAVADALIRAERKVLNEDHGEIGDVFTDTRTDKDGHFRLHLEPDKYGIKVRVPGRGVARYEQQAIAKGEKKTFDINLKHGQKFHATVLDAVSHKPVEGITLFSWQHKGAEGKSNAEGVLDVLDMFPGKFEFNIRIDGDQWPRAAVVGNYARWWSPQAVIESEQKLTAIRYGLVGNWDELHFDIQKDMPPVTIYLQPCATVTGHVVDPDGNPVAGATVAPAATGSGNSITGDTRYSYETDKDGKFTMKLPSSDSGRYNLIAHDGKYEQWRQWANVIGEPFQTQPGERIENVTLRLTRPTTVRGNVLANGKPVAGKQVLAADFQKHDNRYYMPTSETDKNGNFELKFVSPGKQIIQVEPFWLEADQAPPRSSSVVEVKEGQTIDSVSLTPVELPASNSVLLQPSNSDAK